MKQIILSVFAVLCVAGCDGLNSSYDKNQNAGGGNSENIANEAPAPVCQIDFANTCWAASVADITSCMGAAAGEETFSHTKEFCTNTHQKLVAFANPQAMFGLPYDANSTPIDFRVFPDSVNECLRVTGTAQKFKIATLNNSKTMEFDFTGDAMKFTCTDGQTVQVPYEAFEGCTKVYGDAFVNTVPGLQMNFTQKSNRLVWTLLLRGAPQTAPLFSCQEP